MKVKGRKQTQVLRKPGNHKMKEVGLRLARYFPGTLLYCFFKFRKVHWSRCLTAKFKTPANVYAVEEIFAVMAT